MPNFNMDSSTFTHDNPAYQEIASSSNSAAEPLLGLVHTETSFLHAKEALKSILEDMEDEYEDYYEGEGGSVDSMNSGSEAKEDEDSWLAVPSFFSLKDAAKDLRKKYKEAMEEPYPEDPVKQKIAQFYKDTLEM